LPLFISTDREGTWFCIGFASLNALFAFWRLWQVRDRAMKPTRHGPFLPPEAPFQNKHSLERPAPFFESDKEEEDSS
jgi:hypothetical protein